MIKTRAVSKGSSPLKGFKGGSIRIKDEGQLYELVRGVHRKIDETDIKQDLFDGMEEECEIRVVEMKGKKVHALGEMHNSLMPIDAVHHNLAREIEKSPGGWLFLLEDYHLECTEIEQDEDLIAYLVGYGYYVELACLFDIPCHEALSDLKDPDSRREMASLSGQSLNWVDLSIMGHAVAHLTFEERMRLVDLNKRIILGGRNPEISDVMEFLGIIERLGESIGYGSPKENAKLCAQVILMALLGEPRGLSELIPFWNAHSRMRLEALLDSYPGKTNVLAVVGANHLPVFDRSYEISAAQDVRGPLKDR